MVKVKVFGEFRRLVKKEEIHLDLEEGKLSAKEMLKALENKYPQAREKFLEGEADELKQGLAIFVNGRNITYLDGMDTILRDSDKITISPPVTGG